MLEVFHLVDSEIASGHGICGVIVRNSVTLLVSVRHIVDIVNV